MLGGVELLVVPTERLVGTSAQDVLYYRFVVSTVIMAFLSVSPVNLSLVALERFMADLLASVVLV